MEEGSGVDHISKLPEPILHHIQSLLDLKQAVTTSELSKTWNTVWSTLPFLTFDENYFRPRSGSTFQNIETNNWKLIAFIDKTLHHRERTGLRILKFEISTYDLDDIYHNTWIRWIHCLTVCSIDELVIKQPHYSNRILLPPSLLTIESLTSLSLRGCKLPIPSIDQVKLPNLRKLSLETIDIDDQLVGYFISICHKLEYLLVESHRIKQLHISGLPYLKILITKGVEDVRVEASNLQELTFHYGRPPLINPTYCGNALKCLSLAWVSVKDNGWFSRLISNLHVLETLSLDSVSNNDLQISSSSLKHLNLCDPLIRFEAKINAPNLQSFKYKGELFNLLLTNCLVIRQVEIWITDSIIQGYMITKLIQFLGKFNHSQVVKLSITCFQIPVEWRKVLLPPLPNVKHFKCCGIIPSPGNQVTQVLDSFFWLSSRLQVVSLAVESVGRSFAMSAPHFSKYFMITLKASIVNNVNSSVGNTSVGEQEYTLYGESIITEMLRGLTFQISANSFFQTNTRQAEVLYGLIEDFADLKGDGSEVVLDLFCGTGTIGLTLARKAKHVYGYEVVSQAISDASKNAKLNNISNATFVQGDLNKIDENFGNKFPKPDIVISDPNRPGMHMKLIKYLLKLRAPRIVYVSCNPATCARDLDYLCHGVEERNRRSEGCYKLKRLQPVDMFPHTPHIECVCLLELC